MLLDAAIMRISSFPVEAGVQQRARKEGTFMANLTLGLLGPLRVIAGDAPITSFESDKARALLAYLAVESTQPHRRDALVGLLWPDCAEDVARRNLRQALYNLRRAIGDRAAKPQYLLISQQDIQFNTASDYALDVADFMALQDHCDQQLPRCVEDCSFHAERLQEAMALYHGPFLREFFLEDSAEFEEWAVRRREAFHRRAVVAVTYLANYWEQSGNHEVARGWAVRWLELDPWSEPAHRQLMRVLAAGGERGGALAQYETCRRVLDKELGAEPSAETRDLYEQIKRGEPAAQKRGGASVSSRIQPSLPVQVTPFIGRERELEELSGLLSAPDCRLITLVGPGGIGKTRLALQAAANVRDKFTQGAVFVSLGPVQAPAFIVTAVADALGLVFSGTADPKTQILSYLREKEILLVLDNVEHLLAEGPFETGATDLFAEILKRAPRAKLLITSRELLNLQGEWVFEVEGLSVPEEEGDEKSSAVALFLQRGRRAHVGFALPVGDRPAVVRICQLLGGVPLAIELAAAWARTLPPSDIGREIEHSLDFLESAMRDLPERHRSMRAAFGHSYGLLSEEERGILRRLSVFRGGFAREAADEIAGATLSLLSTLKSKSLLRRMPGGRYDLHELIRQFAAEHLAEHPDEQTATQVSHSRYYLTFFTRAKERLQSSAQREALAELTAEMDNFRAAWEWAIAHHDLAPACQVSATLYHVYELRGWFEEGETVFHEAAEAIRSHPEGTDTDQALTAIHIMRTHSAYFSFRLSKSALPYASLSSSAAFLQSSADQFAAAYSMWYLGIVCWTLGRFTEATDCLRVSLDKFKRYGDRWHESAAGEYIGVVVHERGEYEQARPYFVEALAIARELGDPMQIAHILAYMSRTIIALGRLTEAEVILQESLALAQEIGYRSGIGHALDGLGRLAEMTSSEQARTLFATSYDVYKETGDLRNMARVLSHQGYNSLGRGDDADAQNSFVAALRLTREGGFVPFALDALVGLATLQAKQGNMERALELLLIALNHPANPRETQDRAERLRIEIEERLTPQQIELARTRARAHTLDQVVAQVLEQPPGHEVLLARLS